MKINIKNRKKINEVIGVDGASRTLQCYAGSVETQLLKDYVSKELWPGVSFSIGFTKTIVGVTKGIRVTVKKGSADKWFLASVVCGETESGILFISISPEVKEAVIQNALRWYRE